MPTLLLLSWLAKRSDPYRIIIYVSHLFDFDCHRILTPRVVIAIDVYGHFGYLLYRLAYGCIMRSFYMHPAQDTRQTMLERASADYKVQFRAAVREVYNIIASVCSQDDIVVRPNDTVSFGFS